MSQRVSRFRRGRSDEQLVRRAEAVVKKIREDRLPVLRDSEAMDAMISQLEAEPVSLEAGSGAWESLLWLYQAKGETNRAAAVRAAARAVGRDDPEWRHRLAVASRDAGQFNEAVDDYLAVVRADPGRFVASREEFQSAAECVRRAGRMKELTEAFRETDFRAWLARSTTGAGSSAAIGNLAQLARHAMNRGVNAPELSLVLARRLREAVYGRSAYAAHDQSLAETMERAIREMDLAAEERFIEQLELVASPAMMRVIAADREPTRMSPVWVLGMQWRERNVQGLLTQILDQAERSGRLRSLQAAAEIAIEAGEVDKHYLRCLFSLRLDPAAVDEALVHQAVAAASGYRDRPDRRAFLLCILGQELVRGNRPGDAVGVYEKAVLLAQQSAQDATALSASFYLAITHLADGRPEDAQRVLLEPPVARWSSNRPDHINDQRSAAMLMQARKLRILGFYAAAWRRAAEVQALYAAQPGHRRYTDAEEFLQGLLSQDLPRTQDGGEWEALLGDLRAQQERSPGDARLLHQIYRLGEALGREQVAAEALHRLAALEPDDSDVHHLLAQVYFKAGDMEQAYVHLQALLRIEPSRVFAGQADQRMAVEVSQRVGKIPDLVSAVCETAGPRMLGPAQDPSDVERVVMGLLSVASAIQSAPVQSPEDAARILEYVWSTLPGESRLDSLEKRIYHRLVAVHRAMDRPADEFRARIRFTAGSAVARELGFGTRQSMPPDFRAELGWSEAGAPDSAMVRMIEVAGRAGQLEALLGACRRVRNGRPLPPHQLLETLVLLALKRPDDLALTLPRLAELLDRMGFEAAHRLLVQSQIAEGYRQAGDPRTAQYLLRDAWELARAGGRTADESNLVFLLAEALRADERESEAVDLVLRHDPSGGQGEDDEAGASQRLEYAQRAVPYLLGIGHAAAALRKTRREVAWATEHAPVSLRPEFTALRHDAIHRGLPALRQAQPDRFEAELERLHRAVEQGHDEAALEDLYFMLVEAGDVDRLRAVEDRIRGEQPDNGAALMEMARRAWKNGEVERAAGLFEEILYLDPILPFRQGSDYRELVGALAGADRLSVLVEAVEAGFDTVLGSGSTVDDPTRKQVVQRMIDASRRLLVPDLDAATEAKALAEAARRACGRDPAWTAYRDAAEASIRKAITQLSEGEDAYRAFLPWVITPAIANRLGVSGPLEVAAWTADWRWHESTIRCFLDSFLRVLTATGHGPAFVDACLEARGSGDHSAMYLAALMLLREGSASTDLEDAVKSGRAAAMDPSRTAAERMHLLGLLGNELLRAGRLDDAIACFQDAVAAGQESEPEAGLTYLMLYLSEAFEKTGDIEQAEALLITSPWSAEAETRLAGRYADVLLQHHYRVAKRLASMGRIEPADAMLRRLLAIEKGSTRQYYHKKARGLLESL
jgi:tetratricopeptide (TPR) repeat protein